MGKSISQLKKERDLLIEKNTLLQSNRQKLLERQKLESEIRALKNPKSGQAKKALRSASAKFGKFLRKRGSIIGQNINRIIDEEEAKKKKPRMKKTPKRRRR